MSDYSGLSPRSVGSTSCDSVYRWWSRPASPKHVPKGPLRRSSDEEGASTLLSCSERLVYTPVTTSSSVLQEEMVPVGLEDPSSSSSPGDLFLATRRPLPVRHEAVQVGGWKKKTLAIPSPPLSPSAWKSFTSSRVPSGYATPSSPPPLPSFSSSVSSVLGGGGGTMHLSTRKEHPPIHPGGGQPASRQTSPSRYSSRPTSPSTPCSSAAPPPPPHHPHHLLHPLRTSSPVSCHTTTVASWHSRVASCPCWLTGPRTPWSHSIRRGGGATPTSTTNTLVRTSMSAMPFPTPAASSSSLMGRSLRASTPSRWTASPLPPPPSASGLPRILPLSPSPTTPEHLQPSNVVPPPRDRSERKTSLWSRIASSISGGEEERKDHQVNHSPLSSDVGGGTTTPSSSLSSLSSSPSLKSEKNAPSIRSTTIENPTPHTVASTLWVPPLVSHSSTSPVSPLPRPPPQERRRRRRSAPIITTTAPAVFLDARGTIVVRRTLSTPRSGLRGRSSINTTGTTTLSGGRPMSVPTARPHTNTSRMASVRSSRTPSSRRPLATMLWSTPLPLPPPPSTRTTSRTPRSSSGIRYGDEQKETARHREGARGDPFHPTLPARYSSLPSAAYSTTTTATSLGKDRRLTRPLEVPRVPPGRDPSTRIPVGWRRTPSLSPTSSQATALLPPQHVEQRVAEWEGLQTLHSQHEPTTTKTGGELHEKRPKRTKRSTKGVPLASPAKPSSHSRSVSKRKTKKKAPVVFKRRVRSRHATWRCPCWRAWRRWGPLRWCVDLLENGLCRVTNSSSSTTKQKKKLHHHHYTRSISKTAHRKERTPAASKAVSHSTTSLTAASTGHRTKSSRKKSVGYTKGAPLYTTFENEEEDEEEEEGLISSLFPFSGCLQTIMDWGGMEGGEQSGWTIGIAVLLLVLCGWIGYHFVFRFGTASTSSSTIIHTPLTYVSSSSFPIGTA